MTPRIDERIPSAVRSGLLTLVLFLVLGQACPAQTRFEGVFAPQAGKVATLERPARDEISLNGRWQFQPAPLPAGWRYGLDPPPALPAARPDGWEAVPIKIPSPWNVNSFARGSSGEGGDYRNFPSYPKAWESVQMAWMRRPVDVPAGWAGKRVLLRFDAVAGDAVVLVNGKEVGRHFDLFLPFEVDASAAIVAGKANEILVGVRAPAVFNDHLTKNGYRPYPAGSFWGPHIAGIWQDVSLVAVPPVYVTDVFVKPYLDKDVIEVDVTVRNETAAPATVSVSVSVSPWTAASDPLIFWGTLGGPVLSLAPEIGSVPAGRSSTVTLRAKPAGILKPWSPESPTLYGAVVKGGDDVRYARFGWRQVGFSGKQFLLNGKPVTLKGEAWHFMGIPQMTRRYAFAWYKILKEAGANAVRLHAQPYPEYYLDAADEAGIMVIDETAIWASDGGLKVDSEALWKRCLGHVQNLVRRDRNHPSIIGWSVANELLGVIEGVYRAPRAIQDRALEQFSAWARECAVLDPTRPWISGDGEGDAEGRLPVVVVHYPGKDVMKKWAAGKKPWAVGEAGLGYNGTPREVSRFNGERAYESMEGRMEGLAIEAYDHLKNQLALGVAYGSIFNVAWYGLQPLEIGLSDTTRAPRETDGVFFAEYVEGRPGVQPERLGPYSTTINPGYDARLPLYRAWPMFEAIRDAFTGNAASKWAKAPSKAPLPGVRPATVAAVDFLGSRGAAEFKAWGAPVEEGRASSVLLVDGANPPAAGPAVKAVLDRGGTVLVWGVSRGTLKALNAVLPMALELSDRKASSLLPTPNEPLVAGLTPSALYFSESNPHVVLDGGLSGPLVAAGTVLLKAPETDWRRWNGQPEFVKTASVLRSEREAMGSGVAMVSVPVGQGRLLVCKIDLPPARAKPIFTRIMRNLGVGLRDNDSRPEF